LLHHMTNPMTNRTVARASEAIIHILSFLLRGFLMSSARRLEGGRPLSPLGAAAALLTFPLLLRSRWTRKLSRCPQKLRTPTPGESPVPPYARAPFLPQPGYFLRCLLRVLRTFLNFGLPVRELRQEELAHVLFEVSPHELENALLLDGLQIELASSSGDLASRYCTRP
jgi:hypothetical protein